MKHIYIIFLLFYSLETFCTQDAVLTRTETLSHPTNFAPTEIKLFGTQNIQKMPIQMAHQYIPTESEKNRRALERLNKKPSPIKNVAATLSAMTQEIVTSLNPIQTTELGTVHEATPILKINKKVLKPTIYSYKPRRKHKGEKYKYNNECFCTNCIKHFDTNTTNALAKKYNLGHLSQVKQEKTRSAPLTFVPEILENPPREVFEQSKDPWVKPGYTIHNFSHEEYKPPTMMRLQTHDFISGNLNDEDFLKEANRRITKLESESIN